MVKINELILSSLSYTQKLDGFLDIARRNSERCLIIDSDQAPDQVHKLIREIVQNRFGVDLT